MIAETALLTAPVVYGTTALALPDVFEVVSRDLRYCSRPLVRCRRVVECLGRACRGQDNIGASAVGLVVLPPDPTREIARPPQGIRVILPHIPSSDLWCGVLRVRQLRRTDLMWLAGAGQRLPLPNHPRTLGSRPSACPAFCILGECHTTGVPLAGTGWRRWGGGVRWSGRRCRSTVRCR